jgi:hypothetical protein
MNNNFDEINRDDVPEENKDVAAEETPSYTYDYSEDTATSDGVYSMKHDDIIKDDLAPAPDYSTTVTDGEGSIDYAPAESEKKDGKSKKKGG